MRLFEKRPLIQNRQAAKIVEHESDHVEHSRRLEYDRVLSRRQSPVAQPTPRLSMRQSRASAAGSKFATFDEFAFCHPEESGASMVMEISAEV